MECYSVAAAFIFDDIRWVRGESLDGNFVTSTFSDLQHRSMIGLVEFSLLWWPRKKIGWCKWRFGMHQHYVSSSTFGYDETGLSGSIRCRARMFIAEYMVKNQFTEVDWIQAYIATENSGTHLQRSHSMISAYKFEVSLLMVTS